MSNISNIIQKLELAQLCWVVPDIYASMNFLSKTLGETGFPEPAHYNAQALNITYHGKSVPAVGLTTQAYNGKIFIELVQPISGQSIFHDYLAEHPAGGIQHIAYRLPVDDFDSIIEQIRGEGYAVISEVDHPIARMAFFDTYKTLGVVTEIMGITKEGWKAIQQMEKAG